MTAATMQSGPEAGGGPKYVVNIEGENYSWDRATITTEEIRELGGFATTDPIIEVDFRDNSERTLGLGEEVQIKPGLGFGKKVMFKRGQP